MKLALMIDVPNTVPNDGYVRVPGGSFEESLTLAAEMGFDGVELLIDHPDRADISTLPRALAQTGLTVAAINSGRLFFEYGLGLVSPDANIQAASRAALLALARQTAPLNAPINIGVFRGLPDDAHRAGADEQLITILQEAADEIASLGVMLVLEPSNQVEFPFITSTSEGLAFVEQIDRPNVSLMLDTFHMSIEAETMTQSFTAAFPLLHHIHFLDRHRNPPSAASTDFDFGGILRVLCQSNYRHYLSMPLLQSGNIADTTQIITELKTAIRHYQFMED